MTDHQITALLNCAEGLKDIVNAARLDPYSPEEIEDQFAPLLGALYANGISLKGEL